MISRIRHLRASITPEQEILFNRMIMGSVAGFCSFFFAFDPLIFAAFISYLSCNVALFAMQRKNIWRDEERWFAAINLDVLTCFAIMMRAPEQMSVFYPIFLWMILGNGFRFGVKWLFIASILSTAAFGVVVATTAYWQHNLALGYSLTLALFVIPAYCSTLIRKISHAREQAEIASQAKSYFLASVSHELRTPLNAIIGYGNHLRQANLPRNQHEMIEASVLAGEHLLELIEQLIEVAKSGTKSANLKKATFKPTDLLTEIRDIMAVKAAEKGLSVTLHAEPLTDATIHGPRDILRNVLINLSGNAIKFTESGTISISGGLTSGKDKSAIWFTVSDTGIGIADSAIDHIFKPFQQADDTVLNRFGGTGLGLAICKQLVQQAGGSISVTSNIGHGSIFRIEVPVDTNVIEATQEPELEQRIKIVSLGQFAPALLANTQSFENFVVKHLDCKTAADMMDALNTIDYTTFNVAMISENLAREAGAEHPVWQMLSDAEIAPVLAADGKQVDLEDVNLRAAFASVIPPAPQFDELRSAIRIGSSFARQLKIEPTEDVPVPTITPRSILVADDNRTNRNVLQAILEAAGHRVETVTDGDEALDALDKGGFDILLLDINMPRLNGIDACSLWRQTEGGRSHLPIVGVTADATSETEKRCIAAGMDERLTKPVDAKRLLATIEHYCGARDKTVDYHLVYDLISDPLNVVVPIAASGSMLSMASAIDPAQLDYLMSIGDSAFVASMIEGFFEDIEQTIGPMRQSVEKSDVREFRFCAHAYKSAANNMGAKALAALCSKLEKVTESDFDEHRYAYLEKVEREVERVTEALHSPAVQQRTISVAS
jgi:two-component system, sensor histidine kinase RpfC